MSEQMARSEIETLEREPGYVWSHQDHQFRTVLEY